MTLDQFRALIRERIPTAKEFVEFVDGQGWAVSVREDGAAALRAPGGKSDPLVLGLARMLAREPYRTNVLKEAALRWRTAPAPGHVPQPSPVSPTGLPPLREWLWRFGQRHAESPGDDTPPFAARCGDPDHHPAGALWWRHQGEKEWKPVPGREVPAFAPRALPREITEEPHDG